MNPTIRQALADKIATIRIDNGFKTDIEAANIFNGSNRVENMRLDLPQHPKVFMLYEGTDYSELPGNRLVKTDLYSITFSLLANRDNPADTPLTQQADWIIEDFEKLIQANARVGGADLVRLVSVATDAGYADPEAVVAFEVEVSYRKTY
jgi:hypothetical protein